MLDVTILHRHAVKHVKCMECDNIQQPSERCEKWGVLFALYWWLIWNLFDDDGDEKLLFHWEKWGIWRQGGEESSFHCDFWDICLPLSMEGKHICKNYREENWPICFEGFYNVRDGGWLLNWGHLIHSEWFDSYFKTNARWPVCKKFPFSNEAKQEFNNLIQDEIDNTLMSQELSDILVQIIWNDCLEQSTSNFHIVAIKWSSWGGFNTTRI